MTKENQGRDETPSYWNVFLLFILELAAAQRTAELDTGWAMMGAESQHDAMKCSDMR